MTYEVRLDVFEGPIDLLLHLITRQRVDIYDVSISTITEEYAAALTRMENLDLEITTEFLVVAATLLELKSLRLLPGRDANVDPQLLEERDALLARLVECATFRSAGDHIAVELAAGAGFSPRLVPLEPEYAELAPDVLAGVRLEDLGRAAAVALAPKPQVVLDTSHVAPIRASVRDAIDELLGKLRAGGARSFAELCGDRDGKLEVVVRFLALLELFKAGVIELGQRDRFGEITARWTGDGDEEALTDLVDEYSVEGTTDA